MYFVGFTARSYDNACVDVCGLSAYADDARCQTSCVIDGADYLLSDEGEDYCVDGQSLGVASRGRAVCKPCE